MSFDSIKAKCYPIQFLLPLENGMNASLDLIVNHLSISNSRLFSKYLGWVVIGIDPISILVPFLINIYPT